MGLDANHSISTLKFKNHLIADKSLCQVPFKYYQALIFQQGVETQLVTLNTNVLFTKDEAKHIQRQLIPQMNAQVK